MTVRRSGIFAALALAFAMALPAPSYAFLDKTRFVAHLGVAYFCFHHFVLSPYKQGAFAGGAPHRVSSIVKGGAALLFAVHEVKVAQKIADTSRDPLLHKLSGGIASLGASFAGVGAAMKSGKFNPQDVDQARAQSDTVSNDAAADGAQIKDVPVAVPGT